MTGSGKNMSLDDGYEVDGGRNVENFEGAGLVAMEVSTIIKPTK